MRCLSISVIIVLISLFPVSAQQHVGVLDLEAPGFSATEISVLSNKLRSEMVKTGKFLVLERAQMTVILQEQGFQNTGCTSSECAVEMGQLLGVQIMAGGTVGRIGQTWSITLRLIDVQYGKLLKMVDYEMEGPLDDVLKFGISNAARKLCDLPVRERTPVASTPSPVMGRANCDSSLQLGALLAKEKYSIVNGWFAASSLFLFSYTVIYHFLAAPPSPDMQLPVVREIKSSPSVDYECFKEGYGKAAKSRRGTSVLLGTLTCVGIIFFISNAAASSSN
ncbi:MAG: CsgG/HfaB family protein [Fibrobacterota bacterium]